MHLICRGTRAAHESLLADIKLLSFGCYGLLDNTRSGIFSQMYKRFVGESFVWTFIYNCFGTFYCLPHSKMDVRLVL